MTPSGPTARDRVLLLVQQAGNRRWLSDWLTSRLRVTKAGTTVTVLIEDTADSSLPPRLPLLPDEPLAEGGYGQFLIQALVDEVSHRRLRPHGNRITLVKFDYPVAPAPSPTTPS